MIKDRCQKCNQYTWIEEHHILPKSVFKGAGEKYKLCSNCHTDYHQKLGSKNLKNPSAEFHFEKFYRWIAGLTIVIILFLSIFYLKN